LRPRAHGQPLSTFTRETLGFLFVFWGNAYDRSKTLAAAEKARSRGRVRKAVRCYLKVLEHAPDDHVVRSKVAPLLARAGRWDESRQNFDKAAAGYLDAGFVPKAIAVWTVAAQTFPEQVDYWERIANEQEEDTPRGRESGKSGHSTTGGFPTINSQVEIVSGNAIYQQLSVCSEPE
jgi:tetratricopeptide (TPR) repeat protein